MKKTAYLYLTIALIGMGCTSAMEDELVDENYAPIIEKLVRGTTTTERPEVGALQIGSGGLCTGTLVGENLVISAAHCFDFVTQDSNVTARFHIRSNGSLYQYPVSGVVSLGSDAGANDILLARLGQSVPQSVAVPLSIAQSAPPMGSQLTIFGYGCTNRDNQSGAGVKRKVVFRQGHESTNLCPGDSGGPVISETNEITRINSAYWLDNVGADIYGDVPLNFGRLQAAASRLNATLSEQVIVPEDYYDPTENIDEVCGFDVQAHTKWACGDDGSSRVRCRKGHVPEFEFCGQGCRAGRAGESALCLVAADRPSCGPEYAVFSEWTCTSDEAHSLRCRNGKIELQRCPSGCFAGESMPAGCE